jgi:hypothetical protein
MRRLLVALIGTLLVSLNVSGQTVTSIQDGPWNSGSTWDSGVPPTSSNSTSIVIVNSVNVPNSYSVTVDQVFVDIGGVLTVDSGGTITVADDGTSASDLDFYNDGIDYGFLTVNGTLICNNSATITNTDQGNANFYSGSIYRHLYTNTEGSIPIANWDVNSTVQVQGYTLSANLAATAGGNWSQNFGNFVFNCSLTSGRSFDFSGLLTSVQNDLTISSTGASTSASVRLSSTQSPTVAIGRDLIITGSSRVVFTTTGSATFNIGRDFTYNSTISTGSNTNSTGTAIINIARNFSMNATGGQLILASGSAGGSGSLNITGNFTLTAGTITETSTSTGAGNLNFVGFGLTHTFSNSGTISNSINYSVASNSVLNLGTSNLTGAGNLTVNGIMGLGSTDASGALQANTTGGNVRVPVANRTFSSNSTIVYNGAGAQFIGDGFPSSGLVNLTINNSNNVSLSTSLAIVSLSTLNLQTGNLSIGPQTLTINGTVTGSGGIVGGNTSNLTIGGTGNFGTLTFSGTNTLQNFTLNRTSSGLVTLGGDLTIVGTFTQTDGDLDLNGHTFTISGDFARTTGDFLINNASSLVVSGAGALPSSVGFSGTTLGTLTLNRASANLTTTSSFSLTNLNLTSGTFANGTGLAITTGGTITRRANGSMTNSPNNTTNAYNVVYNNSSTATTGPELPSNSTALANLTVSGSGAVNLNSGITINGTLTLTSGSFNAGSNSINLNGNFVSNASSSLTSSAITFAGTTTLSGSSTPTFGAISITGTLTPSSSLQINGNLVNNGTLNAGSGTTTFGGTTAISGSSTSSFNNIIVAAASTLTAPSGAMNVSGNFTNNGTFNHNNGTLTFNGNTSISGTSTTSLYGVAITGTLTAPASTLNIAGPWSTTGTFNNNGGKVVLNGVTAQSITGTLNLKDVDVSNPTGVSNNANISLNGTLTLVSSGIFDADGSGSGVLTVKSTSINAGGRIATLPTPANFSGLVTIERFIDAQSRWRYLSMPLTNGNVGMWKSYFPVTGNFSDPSPAGVNNVTQSSAPSIYSWNPTTAAWVAVGSGGSTSSTSLSNLTGYSPYTYLTSNFTLSVRGNIRTGNASFTLGTGGSGFNLVSNPYPSAIDWDNVTLPGSLSSSMSINLNNGVFASYVKGGAATNAPFGGWTGEVAIGQSFWVQSTGATSLTFTESAKTGNNYQYLRTSDPNNLLRITLTSLDQKDESVVWFQSAATDSTDNDFDALKRKNGFNISPLESNSYLNLSTYNKTSSMDYSINGLSPINCSQSIKIKIEDMPSKAAKLMFTNLPSFDLGYEMTLIDRYLNKSLALSDSLTYDFVTNSDPASSSPGRFEILFSLPRPKVTISGTTLSSSMTKGNQWLLDGKPILGATGSQYQVTKSGTYSVQVTNGDCALTSENIVLIVTGIENASSQTVKAYPNPVKDVLNLELINSFNYIKIYNIQGKLIDSIEGGEGVKSLRIDFSTYQSGTYVVNVLTENRSEVIKIIKD